LLGSKMNALFPVQPPSFGTVPFPTLKSAVLPAVKLVAIPPDTCASVLKTSVYPPALFRYMFVNVALTVASVYAQLLQTSTLTPLLLNASAQTNAPVPPKVVPAALVGVTESGLPLLSVSATPTWLDCLEGLETFVSFSCPGLTTPHELRWLPLVLGLVP